MDVRQWRRDDVLLGLLAHGYDAVGDLVLGETALNWARHEMDAPRDVVSLDDREKVFSLLAEAALRGDAVGSSVGGEQPKFVCTLRESTGYRSVIVKFSERTETAAGRRWADLLICEHLACETLRHSGVSAAQSELVYADRRVFLQSTRFDRTPCLGRGGFVSLAAVDAAHYGYGRIDWWRFASELERDGWLSPADARRLRQTAWFGVLIANTDMHLGNAALRLLGVRARYGAAMYESARPTERSAAMP